MARVWTAAFLSAPTEETLFITLILGQVQDMRIEAHYLLAVHHEFRKFAVPDPQHHTLRRENWARYSPSEALDALPLGTHTRHLIMKAMLRHKIKEVLAIKLKLTGNFSRVYPSDK